MPCLTTKEYMEVSSSSWRYPQSSSILMGFSTINIYKPSIFACHDDGKSPSLSCGSLEKLITALPARLCLEELHHACHLLRSRHGELPASILSLGHSWSGIAVFKAIPVHSLCIQPYLPASVQGMILGVQYLLRQRLDP